MTLKADLTLMTRCKTRRKTTNLCASPWLVNFQKMRWAHILFSMKCCSCFCLPFPKMLLLLLLQFCLSYVSQLNIIPVIIYLEWLSNQWYSQENALWVYPDSQNLPMNSIPIWFWLEQKRIMELWKGLPKIWRLVRDF